MRIKNKKMMVGIISLIILLSLSYISFSADSNDFDSTIDIATSTAKGLTVALIEPDMAHYGAGNIISFKAVASYNKSMDLSCELLVDNDVIDSMAVTDGNELIVSNRFTFNKGAHSWFIRCIDALNNSATSSEKRFIVDLQGPSIKLNNNPDISFNDYIELKFTPTDDYSSTLNCDVFINSIKNASVDASNNQEKKVKISSLMDGAYKWNVACKDELGNEGSGSESSFTIDTKRNFSIFTNKEDYEIGEKGIYYLKAPDGSIAKVLITDPRGATTVKNLNGPFPAMDDMGPFDYAGEYTIDAYITLDGAVKQTSKKVSVNNNMHVGIEEIEKKIYTKGSTVSFSAEGRGGLGSLTYTWNFGDKTSDDTSEATGASVSHRYDSFGSFDATVTVKDEKDNKATDSVKIDIQEPYPVKIIVVDRMTGEVISGATVYLDGEQKSTDSLGAADYNMFEGKYSLTVKKDSYRTYARDVNVQRNLTAKANLERLDVNGAAELSPSSSSDKGEVKGEVDDGSLAAEIKSVIASIDSSISSISDDDEVIALKIKEGLESSRSQLNIANRDLLNLNINEKGLTDEEIAKQKGIIEANVNRIKNTTLRSFEIEDKSEIIMILSDSEVDKISEEYLKSIDAEFKASQLKSLQQDNRKIKSSLTVNRQYSVGSLEYLSGNSEPITLVIDKIVLKDHVPDSSLVLFVPKDIASDVKEMGIITDNTIINKDPLIGFSINEEDIVYYFKKQLTKEDINKVLPSLMASEKGASSSGITGFAMMPNLGKIDNPLLIIEVIIIVILVLAFFVYQFDVVGRVKGINPSNSELRQTKFLINQTRNHVKRKDLDSAEESYGQLTKEFKALKAIERSKVEKHVKDIDCLMIFAKLDSETDRALQYIKEGKHSKAKASYRMIKDIYKDLPKEYKEKACNKCEDLFKKLSL